MNEPAERALLGAIMLCAQADGGIEAVRRVGYLQFSDFYVYKNGLIYRAIEKLCEIGIAPTYQAIIGELEKSNLPNGRNALEAVGGAGYIHQILSNATDLNVANHAELIKREAIFRSARIVGKQIENIGSYDLKSMSKELRKAVFDVLAQVDSLDNNSYDTVASSIAESAQAIKDSEEGIETGVATQINAIDSVLVGGLQPGNIYTFASPPGWGKSLLGMAVGLNVAKSGKRVHFISLEMTVREITQRILASECGVELGHILSRKLNEEDVRRLNMVGSLMSYYKDMFIITEMNRPTMADIEAKLSNPLMPADLIIIDWAGYETIDAGGDAMKATIDIFSELKSISQRLNVPIMVATQMNRNYQTRADKRPESTDLAYSSSIEKISAGVFFLYNERMVNPLSEKLVHLIWTKSRHTARAETLLDWQPEYCRLADVTTEHIEF